MAKNDELSVRQQAGLVEEDFEKQPRDEAVEQGEHVDFETQGYVDGVIMHEPSTLNSAYMSEEEQGMELKTEVVGPPGYGSPVPETSAGKLLSLRDHPLRADSLPEGHPAAVAEDYGVNHLNDTVMPGETSSPVIPDLTDLETDLNGREAEEVDATEGAAELAESEGVDLSDVEGSGKDGRVTKGDVENFIAERDSNDDTNQ